MKSRGCVVILPCPPAVAQHSGCGDCVEHTNGGADADGLIRAAKGSLAEYLGRVVDHRSRQGLRYELGLLLAVVMAATACVGRDEVAAQAQWAADAPVWVLTALGARPDPLTGAVARPNEATLRRVLAEVDAADLQRLSSEWVAALRAGHHGVHHHEGGTPPRLPAVAIDGKSVRGAAAGGNTRPHLLSAATHDGAIVIAQRQISDKGSEIGELAALVTDLDLSGVVTVHALHTQRATTEHLAGDTQADYVLLTTRFLASTRSGGVGRVGLVDLSSDVTGCVWVAMNCRVVVCGG